MTEGVRIEGSLPGFIKELMESFSSIESIDGSALVEDGQLTTTDILIDETLFSNSNEAAIKESEYVEARKTGEETEPEDTEKIDRLERDILKNKSKGFIYGNGRSAR